jgi:acyl carrier protein
MDRDALEAALAAHPEVKQAAVAVHKGAFESPLLAYVVAGEALEAAELRRHLAATLPGAPAPDLFVLVDGLPCTPGGDLDRAALSKAGRGGDASPEIVAGAAAVVADVWREILRVDRVGLDDDLYSLGGHSLSITRMAVQIKERTGVEVPLTVFYDTPTVPGIAAALEELGAG